MKKVLLALTMLLLAASCNKVQAPQTSVQQDASVSTQTNQQSSTNKKPADETTNWKVYSNSEFGFEFKYPDTLEFIRFSDNRGEYSGGYEGVIQFQKRDNKNILLSILIDYASSDSKELKTQSDFVIDSIPAIRGDTSDPYNQRVQFNYKNRHYIIEIVEKDGPSSITGTREDVRFDSILSTFKFTK